MSSYVKGQFFYARKRNSLSLFSFNNDAGYCIGVCLLYQPVVNLGYTSFYDGSPPSGHGFYFQDYFQYYSSNRFNDQNGNQLPLPRTDLDVIANVTQLFYVSPIKIFRTANLGVSTLLPWVINANVNDGLHNTVLKAQNWPGDLWIGPELQFDPLMRKDGKGPLFVQRFEFDVIAPIGRYTSVDAINPSSHFWSLNQYWAFTFWMTPNRSTAARFHYLWNGVNHSPNVSFGPTAYTTQAGQAIFADIAVGYALIEKLTLGVNGYFSTILPIHWLMAVLFLVEKRVFGQLAQAWCTVLQKIILSFSTSTQNKMQEIARKEPMGCCDLLFTFDINH
ncbi:MAG: SphA family protein [Legionella sp.]